jgi:hypothetical protein
LRIPCADQPKIESRGLLLLIDNNRSIESLAGRNVRAPFVREQFRNDLARVCARFDAWRNDLRFIAALGEELRHCHGSMAPRPADSGGIIDAGMRAIAGGMIDVGSMLPDAIVVTFDESRPTERFRLGMVVFIGRVIFDGFVLKVLNTAKNRQAFEAALDHPAGRPYATAASTQDATDHARWPAGDTAALATRGAWLLASRLLALVPLDPSRRRLRLVWVEHAVAAAGVASPPPAAPPRRWSTPVPAPTVYFDAPASVLPKAPAHHSPQARTLIVAAKHGKPFCEECARRAAALTHA